MDSSADFYPDSSIPSLCDTYHAPAGRDTADEFRRKVALLEGTRWLGRALNAMPNMALILNSHRQIVAANDAFFSLLRASRGEVVEKRLGEAVGCVRASEGPNECGTARQCVTCGAVHAILECLRDEKKSVRECRILVESPVGVVPMDLRVTASPFEVAGERFVAAALEDISHSKRLAVMQRLFFHDLLNTAGCISGYAQCLRDDGSLDRETGAVLADLSDQLIESIRAQRDLLFAESENLAVQRAPIRTLELIEDLCIQCQKHPVAQDRVLKTGPVWDGAIISDGQLLRRVLVNMIKNALEATAPGGAVTVSLHDHGNHATFAVRNAGTMPDEVQFQVFQRSFSTKGETGRGIGTYSMKLFGERYLGGKVGFTSNPDEGTIFTFTVPKVPRQAD